MPKGNEAFSDKTPISLLTLRYKYIRFILKCQCTADCKKDILT